MSGAVVMGSARLLSAASATASLPISVVVGNNCTISTTAVAFPNYDPIATHVTNPDDSTAGAVTITCTRGTAATIGLGLGANALVNQRRMEDVSAATNYINYELYQNVGRTTVWGNAAPNLFTPPVAPDKNPHSFTVYGRIPAGQDVLAGTYNDTVVATVNF
jgi:spore coat protein U-like protein